MPTPYHRAAPPPSHPGSDRLQPSGQGRINPAAFRTGQEDQGFYPIVGLVATVTCTLLAMAFVPRNPQKEGVLALSGLSMCVGLLVAPLLAFLKNPRNILRTENVIGMAGIYWLYMDLVTAVYDLPTVDKHAVRMAFLSSGSFVAMFWIGTLKKPWNLPKAFQASCSFRPEASVILPITTICFFLSMLAFAIPSEFDLGLMFRSLLQNRFAAPWSRGDLGGWNAFVDHLTYFGYLLPTLAVMLARRKGFFHPVTIVGMLFAFVFLVFLMHSGSRRIIGVCLGSALIYWVLDREKVRVYQLVVSTLVIASILWLMQGMLVFRSLGLGEVGAGNAAKIAWHTMKGGDAVAGAPKGLAVDDNFYRLTQMHSIVPDAHPFVYWKHLWYVLVRPIPRVFWPNKPIDGGFRLQDFDDKGASLSMSIVGEAWLSWGFIAVFAAGWLFGRLARMNSPLFHGSSGSVGPMFYGYMTMMLFVGWRALQEILLFSYALLGWVLATWIYSKFQSRRFSGP